MKFKNPLAFIKSERQILKIEGTTIEEIDKKRNDVKSYFLSLVLYLAIATITVNIILFLGLDLPFNDSKIPAFVIIETILIISTMVAVIFVGFIANLNKSNLVKVFLILIIFMTTIIPYILFSLLSSYNLNFEDTLDLYFLRGCNLVLFGAYLAIFESVLRDVKGLNIMSYRVLSYIFKHLRIRIELKDFNSYLFSQRQSAEKFILINQHPKRLEDMAIFVNDKLDLYKHYKIKLSNEKLQSSNVADSKKFIAELSAYTYHWTNLKLALAEQIKLGPSASKDITTYQTLFYLLEREKTTFSGIFVEDKYKES